MNPVREGQGPIVVLSHALGLDSDMWGAVASDLAADHDVIRFDHRGHGGSPAPAGPITIDDLADDAATLIRSVGTQPVVFAGLSLGGMVGQALAARHAELLRGVAIVNSAAHYADRTLWDQRIASVSAQGMGAVADSSLDRWLTADFRQTPEGQAVAQQLRATLMACNPAGYVRCCEAIAAMDLRAGNRASRTPTLVIAGLRDLATPLAQSESMAADIAGAQLRTIDAAHISAAEKPLELASLLREWIKTLPGG